jgi:hypothetical protein
MHVVRPTALCTRACRSPRAFHGRARALTVHASMMTTVVTGAGGRTGLLAVKKLLAEGSQFDTRAVVRDEKASPVPE